MKQLLCVTVSALIIIGTGGCKKDFLDINQNPNTATTENIAPNLLLPNAMHVTGARISTTYGWAANWMGYWAPSGTYAPDVQESTYNISNTFQQGQWTGWYDNLFDYRTAENKAKESGEDFYRGMSIIMQTIGWSSLVDMYGNIPYTKAFDLAGNIQPAYDKGEDIYKDLLVRLDTGIRLVKSSPELNPTQKTFDVMFGGNPSLWIKFANTLKLKLLIHQSQIPGFSPAAEIAKIVSEGSGFLGMGQTAQVQPGYIVTANKLNPFWVAYKQNEAGIATNEFFRANNFVLNLLRSNNDERYKRYFEPVGGTGTTYTGVTYGNLPDVNFNSSKTSNVAGPGLAKSATQPQWVLTATESLFLQAEAIARGWLTGDAKTAYENAVRESFDWLGVPNSTAVANAYLNQTVVSTGGPNTITNWASVATGTIDQKARFIVFQKYLSLVGINNLEAWTDWRRLNVPPNVPISTNPAKISNTLPIRLLYPATEVSYNSQNVNAQGTISQFNSPIFWDK